MIGLEAGSVLPTLLLPQNTSPQSCQHRGQKAVSSSRPNNQSAADVVVTHALQQKLGLDMLKAEGKSIKRTPTYELVLLKWRLTLSVRVSVAPKTGRLSGVHKFAMTVLCTQDTPYVCRVPLLER